MENSGYDIIGKIVSGIIDRPIGSQHPSNSDIIYPINYGYVENVFADDGEEQDVYVFGTNIPINRFKGKVIAIYHRTNDVEDKVQQKLHLVYGIAKTAIIHKISTQLLRLLIIVVYCV